MPHLRLVRSTLLSLAFLPALAWPASRLTNVSVRSSAGSGADTLIVGFSIAGTGTKSLLLRGVGPALGAFGVSGVVTDPELRLFNATGATVASNDNWDGNTAVGAAADAVAAFRLPNTSRDAALLLNLAPGAYSAHLLANSGPGIALVEGYDTDTGTPAAQLSNVSTRSIAGTGAAVLTIGFAIAGDTPKTVLIRAVGPTLASFGVPGALSNPQVRLFSSRNTELVDNDDWLVAASWSPVFATAGAFSLGNTGTRDAALVVNLAPGSYTAQASGVGATTGIALLEVYDVPSPPAGAFVFRPVENTVPADFPRSTNVATNARPTFQARPQYPFEARRAGISGEALVQFAVGTDGRVMTAVVLRSADIEFAQAALAAVRQWLFEPARNAAGDPVITIFQVPIVFTITG